MGIWIHPLLRMRFGQPVKVTPRENQVNSESWTYEGYCRHCNRIVATNPERILFTHDLYVGECRGSGERAPDETPTGEVKKFAFKVRPERLCNDARGGKEHRAHEYRIAVTYWCQGYERPF